MADRLWRWVTFSAVLWYCVFAILLIEAKPGFQYDEAIDVLASVHLRHSHEELKLPHAPHTWFCVRQHCFPLMSAQYIGSIKEYICLPLFAVFGPRAEVVRLLAMAFGALGIFGVATLLGQQGGYPVAAAAAWAMAVHPSYLAMTVLDNSAFSPWMGAFGLLCLAVAAYLENPSSRSAFWVGAAMGFGVWARANYVWLLAALFAALVISGGRRMLLPYRHWASIIGGGLVGGLPFVAYQLLSRGGTLEAADSFSSSAGFAELLLHRLTMLSETFLADGEHRAAWGGPPLPSWQLWLFPALVAVGCLVCVALKQQCGFLPRAAALTALLLAGVFFFSGLPVAEHHMVTVVPIAAMVVALAGWELSHRSRFARLAVIAVAAVYAGSAIYWQFATVAGLRSTGGIGVWSDGIYPLTERLRADFPGREIKVLDWGLQNSVYVLSDGRVRTKEIFWDATADKAEWNTPWQEEIRHGGLFLRSASNTRETPSASASFLKALVKARPSVRRTAFPERNGGPYAELIEIVPDSIGTGPAPGYGVEILPADVMFGARSKGFYALEPGGWRWTGREFSLAFPPTKDALVFTMHVSVPEACIRNAGMITMSLCVGEHTLAPETFSRPGDYTVARTLQTGWMSGENNGVAFHLDKVLPATKADGRELGIVFVSAKLEAN
jgi:hypothetical protein